MTNEEKVPNGRNSRGSRQFRNGDLTGVHASITEMSDSVVETAEEKLQDVIGNLIHSPAIDPSILQTDVIAEGETSTSTTVAPALPAEPVSEAPLEGAAAESTPAAEPAEPAQSPTEGAPPPPADQTVATESQEPTAASTPESTEPTEPAVQPEVKTELPEAQTQENPPDEPTTPTSQIEKKKFDEKSDRGKRPASVRRRPTRTPEVTTTATPSNDPYQIDITIQKKINKRTQRKLWEEIEKRKPLIPKYVERHIQKYAKPPFQLWGCKFRGKGSCYGCTG